MKKRSLSLLLALVMALGLIVSAVPAASAAKAKTLPFKDVTSQDWFFEYVKFVYERDIMKGVSGTEFGPHASMTRGQIVTILSRMSGDNVDGAKSSLKFTDVDPKMYYADPIGWAVSNGIAKGKGADRFDPDAPVLRQEFAAFFVRYMKYKGIEFPGEKVTPFPDSDIPDWAEADVETLHSIGLVKGDAQGKFNPKKQMTRAEIATVVMRFVEIGETPPEPPVDTLKKKIDDLLEEKICLAHGKLDLIFGTSDTIDSLPDVLTDIFGYEASVKPDDLDYIKSDYGGLGGEQTAWIDGIPVTFTDPSDGSSYEVEIDLSIYKSMYGKYSGAITDRGSFGTCHEDYPDGIKNALKKVAGWDDETHIVIPGDSFTPGAIEAWYRETVGLAGDEWTFFIDWFDAEKAYEGNEVAIALRCDDVNGEGRTVIVACGPVLSIEEPVVRSLEEIVESSLSDNCCSAHHRLDFIFSDTSGLTEENLFALVKEVLRLPDSVTISFKNEGYDFENLIRAVYDESGSDDYTVGSAELAANLFDAVPFRFSDSVTDEVYEADIDLAIYKVPVSRDLGYPCGVRGVCPDVRDPGFHSAGEKLSSFKNTKDGEGADIALAFDGDFTPDGIEEKAREVTGLSDAEKYRFFILGYDASKYSVGVKIRFGFIDRSGAVPKDSLDLIMIETVLKAADGAEDPMHDIIDEKLTDLLCLAHNKLDILFGDSSTFIEENLNAVLKEAFGLGDGYTVEVDPDDFADAKDTYSGAGSGNYVWIDEIAVNITNTVTGETLEESVDFSFLKILLAKYTGALETCALSLCWDDVTKEMKDAMNALAEFNEGDPKTVEVPEGEEYGAEWIENYFRQKSGLTDSERFVFFSNGIDTGESMSEDGNYVQIAFLSVAEYEDIEGARTYAVCAEAKFKTVDPMYTKIDDVLDEITCISHGHIDIQFGRANTLTQENLNAILTDLFGLGENYTVAVDGEEFESFKEESYAGAGNGTVWERIDVLFTNNVSGVEYTVRIDFGFQKEVFADYTHALSGGALTWCWDDRTAEMNRVTDALHDLMDEVVEFEDYTPAAVEAFFREQTGLADNEEYEFYLAWFDAEAAATDEGNEIAVCFKNVSEGRTFTAGCSTIMKSIGND